MAVNINIPSQVKTYANLAAFPASGSLKTIYIAEDTNKTYRWTGSVYVEISASAAMTWGQIGGTLSNQTDLQNALDAKVPTARTLTINGTTQDLSANRTFTIPTDLTVGTTPISSGTIGRVLFQGTGNVLQQSSSLFWDGTNNRLGIGTSTPANPLDVVGNLGLINTSGTNRSTQLSTSGSSDNLPSISFYPATGTNVGQSFDIIPKGTGYSSGIKTQFGIWGTDFIANQTNYELLLVRATGSSYTFESFKGGTGAHRPILLSAGASNQLWAYTSGNVGINTTTDAGFRLDVNGTARVSGSSFLASTFLTAGGSQLGVGTSSINAYYRAGVAGNIGTTGLIVMSSDISGSGTPVYLERTASLFNVFSTLPMTFSVGSEAMRIFGTTRNIGINTTTDAGFRLDVNGTARVQGNATVSLNQNNTTLISVSNTTAGTLSNAALQLISDASAGQAQVFKYSSTRTSYKTILANDFGHYNATAGDISFLNDVATGQIKFTAGGSSTVHMTIKSNGRINMSSLPTSSAGLSAGDLWNDGGTLKIV